MLKSNHAMALAMMALILSVPPAEARGFGRGASFARFSGAALGAYLRKSRRPGRYGQEPASDSDLPGSSEIVETPRVGIETRSILDSPSGRVGAASPRAEMRALVAPVAHLQTKEEWSAECGKVGTLAGSGMGFCVVNDN